MKQTRTRLKVWRAAKVADAAVCKGTSRWRRAGFLRKDGLSCAAFQAKNHLPKDAHRVRWSSAV